MQPDLNDFFREPDEPRKVETDWHEDLILVKVGNYRLGLEANLAVLKVVVDVLEFTQLLSQIEKDQMSDNVARVILNLEGK